MRAPGGKAAGGRATWGPQGLGCGGILASASGHVAGHRHPASEPRASYL